MPRAPVCNRPAACVYGGPHTPLDDDPGRCLTPHRYRLVLPRMGRTGPAWLGALRALTPGTGAVDRDLSWTYRKRAGEILDAARWPIWRIGRSTSPKTRAALAPDTPEDKFLGPARQSCIGVNLSPQADNRGADRQCIHP